MTVYKKAKTALKETALWVKRENPTDKPLIRMTINDFADYLSRKCNLTDHQRNLLSNYACKLHPKN